MRLWTITTLTLLAGAVVFLYANGRSGMADLAQENERLAQVNDRLRNKLVNKEMVIHALWELVFGELAAPPEYYDKILRQIKRDIWKQRIGNHLKPEDWDEIRKMTKEKPKNH